jgi:hypothetical protein
MLRENTNPSHSVPHSIARATNTEDSLSGQSPVTHPSLVSQLLNTDLTEILFHASSVLSTLGPNWNSLAEEVARVRSSSPSAAKTIEMLVTAWLTETEQIAVPSPSLEAHLTEAFARKRRLEGRTLAQRCRDAWNALWGDPAISGTELEKRAHLLAGEAYQLGKDVESLREQLNTLQTIREIRAAESRVIDATLKHPAVIALFQQDRPITVEKLYSSFREFWQVVAAEIIPLVCEFERTFGKDARADLGVKLIAKLSERYGSHRIRFTETVQSGLVERSSQFAQVFGPLQDPETDARALRSSVLTTNNWLLSHSRLSLHRVMHIIENSMNPLDEIPNVF